MEIYVEWCHRFVFYVPVRWAFRKSHPTVPLKSHLKYFSLFFSALLKPCQFRVLKAWWSFWLVNWDIDRLGRKSQKLNLRVRRYDGCASVHWSHSKWRPTAVREELVVNGAKGLQADQSGGTLRFEAAVNPLELRGGKSRSLNESS